MSAAAECGRLYTGMTSNTLDCHSSLVDNTYYAHEVHKSSPGQLKHKLKSCADKLRINSESYSHINLKPNLRHVTRLDTDLISGPHHTPVTQ